MRRLTSRVIRKVILLILSVLTVATLLRSTTQTVASVQPSAVLVDLPSRVGTTAVHIKAVSTSCLTAECFRAQGNRLARAFPDQPKASWCITERSEENTSFRDGKWQGLLLVKVPKCASSTAAGLTLRIANRTHCAAQFEHRQGIHYQQRHAQSFLFATIRHPAARAFSMAYFFIIAPLNMTPSDDNVITALNRRRGGKTKGKGGFMLDYIALTKIPARSAWTPDQPKQVRNETAVTTVVREIVQSYDFLLVVERMDESLTALAMMTGLSLGDVLSTNSKVAGQYLVSTTGKHKGQCIQQVKGRMSVGVQRYLESSMWKAMNYGDYVLYEAANRSLDLTIDRLGRDKFNKQLVEFQRLKSQALQVCGDHLGLGCTSNGVPNPDKCYLRDFGCGYQCVDAMLRDDSSSLLL
jgi:hypothetical protein